MNRHGFDDDEAGSALSVAYITIGNVLVDEAVLAGQTRHHCRHHDPIGNQHPADIESFE
jgi:hypothetical protein